MDRLGRIKLALQKKFIGLIKVYVVILERGNPGLIARTVERLKVCEYPFLMKGNKFRSVLTSFLDEEAIPEMGLALEREEFASARLQCYF